MCVCVPVQHVCGDQRLTLGYTSSSIAQYFIFFIHCLSLSLELTNYLDLLVSEPQVFSSSLLSSCGIAGVLPHLAVINWGSEYRPS